MAVAVEGGSGGREETTERGGIILLWWHATYALFDCPVCTRMPFTRRQRQCKWRAFDGSMLVVPSVLHSDCPACVFSLFLSPPSTACSVFDLCCQRSIVVCWNRKQPTASRARGPRTAYLRWTRSTSFLTPPALPRTTLPGGQATGRRVTQTTLKQLFQL